MGDAASHLEKMGRELKCPICLSLFNSAVSLTCNHVFCNACIVKSMKVDATCPVCKIPFHRREIRGAPHMDSLVSIYKNMEVASGAHLFVSQTKQSSPPEKEQHMGDASTEKTNDKKRQGSSKGRTRTSKKRGSKKTKETDVDSSGPIVMKPSSQTNKRVQLSQSHSSHSLPKSTESLESSEKLNKDYTDNTVIRLNENPSLNKEENLAPLFWLRDEGDGESLSQPTESDQLLDVTPVDVPSFSDLKDSDHENPSKAVEKEKPNPGDMFDSEMFEWTQRPCSPEILPSPVKAKTQGRGEIDLPQSKLSKDASSNKKRREGSARNKVAKVRVGVSKDYMEASAGEAIGEKQETGETSGKSTRKDGKLDEKVKAKRTTRNKGQTSRVQSGVKESVEAEGKQGTKRKRSSVKVSADHPVAGSNQFSLATENVGKGDQEPEKQITAEKPSVKKRRKSQIGDLSGKIEKKTSEKRSKPDSCATPSRVTQPCGKKILSDELNQVGDRQDSTNKEKPNVDKGNHTVQDSEKHSTMNKPSLGGGSVLLRPCDGLPTNKLTCAFCQSSDETEASGKMAHYHKGEPVSADFSGGSNVIHVHKNCTEWAPNVYFNRRTAVNLDVELTRSRRITCSCCGLKGAALGCYNESCKNSFHVTCAKLIPECRWDDKNFVMLCPMDASSKLPCEETSPKGRKRQLTPKGPLQSQPNQVPEKSNITELQSKPFHGLPKKMVLCCSGLTDEEKSVISEFAELSGVTISRKWEPRVTHVIASTNENGSCKRTLKFMMGILEGKWILSIDWIKACMKNRKYVREEPYEISIDVHGTRQGPYIGRQRALNKEPKLFNGLKFYMMGDFEVAYKGYLQDMIVAAGGTILRRRPISSDDNEASTIVVFNVEPSKKKTLTERRSDADALARSVNARAASSSWVLDSIAGCQILDLI
ncbi:Protein BREAST CANCER SUSCEPTIBILITY 1-like protein [Raphanus sativus]|uniref:Protein BREAST CANCER SUSCEPTIBILITY 1 homolog isoform X2 n=1 Tax=Raphanus sativus TaxID=3726 RepID=A0A6J0KIZ6_RAPSA|nr:protein BREAST CANCER SUSCEPTIBILITY 1 homolog isoform X2 [Raphanus sativus]KAJ4880895.1 Protein BREAST CANCER SUSCEPTIBILITY 1-like protein [Raphanus sativus]